jgi:MFS family permease
VGTTTFLLPLLFQLGFGMDPLHSGLLSCATAMGAMFMKTLTVWILRRYGFRRVLTVNAVTASLAVAACALFTAATPHLVIFIVLLIAGCLRSLQFTSLQAISFAEITRETMSQGSSIASMAQRLAQSLGVAVGAYALELSSAAQGHADIVAADFPPALIAVSVMAAMSLFLHLRLAPDAGAEVSGQVQR